MRKFIAKLVRAKWVVFTTVDDSKPELGLKVCGIVFALYKGEVYCPSNVNFERQPEKREFGESLHPLDK